MRLIDFSWSLLLFFPGVSLLVLSIIRARRESLATRFASRYAQAHRELTRTMIEKGWLSYPGIRLVDPLKSWICAELVLFCTILLLVSRDFDAGNILLAIPAGIATGQIVLLLSLKRETFNLVSGFQQDLPLAAFLMSLLMESGMGSASAMRETVAALPRRECAAELAEIMRGRELGVGKRTLFETSRNRVPIDDYRAFLNLIEQGERLGVGLSQGMNDLSRRILESQSHRAEMRAQQAAVKMLLPLVLFIFPAVFLVILSPVILSLLDMAAW